MDLGIAGRTALVCASSRGLGFACARALAHEGVHVIINGRDPERLATAEAALRKMARVMKGLALDIARHNITINNLLPERIDTDRQHQMAQDMMKRFTVTYEEARRRQTDSIAAKRLGRPEEFGATCAFLCSAQAGFMSGQNIHLDGGSYPALI
jgi:3-oxoacyl-[acyl-carrier protein] reductase